MNHKKRILSATLFALTLAAACDAGAVRVNADGHGQALIYPYYTARSTISGNAFVTAFSTINTTDKAKALKVRFLEGKTGAPVFDFNLFLSAYDVWTAGIVAAGEGAGIFTQDNSCAVPSISRDSAAPSKFQSVAYVGDTLGDSLDRTYEGYFEVLEMGTIDPASPLGVSITHVSNYSGNNLSKPPCTNLPSTDALPTALSRPAGGLMGNASYINVNEGTDFSADAVALSQWSDKPQWSKSGSASPNLSDASPFTSLVVDSRPTSDTVYVTRWSSGRDAVSALFMVDHVRNDYSVEFSIKAATDWIVTMPTKRFYVDKDRTDPPFSRSSDTLNRVPYNCETSKSTQGPLLPLYYDREAQSVGLPIDFAVGSLPFRLCGAATAVALSPNSGSAATSHVFQSVNVSNLPLNATWINGWLDMQTAMPSRDASGQLIGTAKLVAPVGSTSVMDSSTGAVTSGVTATYLGLPIVGFSGQSYSTMGLPGINPNILSNYGGSFVHKFTRHIEVSP